MCVCRVTLEKGNLLRVRIFKNQDEDLFEVLMGFRPREKVVFQQDFRLESDLDINSISAIREGNMLKVLLPYSRKQTVKTQRRRIRVDGPKTEVTDAQDAGELPDIRKETKGKEVVMIPAAEEAGPSSITFNDWASGAEEKEEFEKNDHRQEDVAANVEEVKVSRRHEKRMSDDEDGSIEDCEY